MQGEWSLPVPKGWHRVADARSLAPGGVRPGRVDGHELVVYRTESGEARVAGAWCPHLGAHLGHCGRVEAEQLRCTFHGLRFDGAGQCDATGYGTKPPPSARLKPWPTREAYGQIFAWYDPAGTQPDWSLPTLDEAGWTSWRSTSWRLPTHPQDIAENSVDLGHFGWVHGYHAVRELRTPEAEGPCLKVWYDFERPLPGLTLRGAPRLKIEIAGEVWGLGCTIVDVRIRSLGFRARNLVAVTPTAQGEIDLCAAISIRGDGSRRPFSLLPRWLLEYLVAPGAIALYAHDVEQDFVYWKNKRYEPRPTLADGDGPIGRYRRWARQFYAADADDSARPGRRALAARAPVVAAAT
jgi:nitrite reductase/ring-hydroxylating ferredoxin subunit